jgi:hypothetical protein
MTHRPLLLALVPLLAVPACSNDNGSVDIGRNVGNQLADYAATWDGYAEAYQFDDGSDRIRVTLDASGRGTLVAGDQPAPPPLPIDDPSFDITAASLPFGPVPGLPYEIGGAHVQDKRIQLSINPNEQFRQWCAAQPSICDGDTCACIRNYGSAACRNGNTCTATDPTTGETVTFSKTRFFLCTVGGPCMCTAAGCSVGEPTTLFDAALENGGTELVGTLIVGPRVTVRMSRQ